MKKNIKLTYILIAKSISFFMIMIQILIYQNYLNPQDVIYVYKTMAIVGLASIIIGAVPAYFSHHNSIMLDIKKMDSSTVIMFAILLVSSFVLFILLNLSDQKEGVQTNAIYSLLACVSLMPTLIGNICFANDRAMLGSIVNIINVLIPQAIGLYVIWDTRTTEYWLIGMVIGHLIAVILSFGLYLKLRDTKVKSAEQLHNRRKFNLVAIMSATFPVAFGWLYTQFPKIVLAENDNSELIAQFVVGVTIIASVGSALEAIFMQYKRSKWVSISKSRISNEEINIIYILFLMFFPLVLGFIFDFIENRLNMGSKFILVNFISAAFFVIATEVVRFLVSINYYRFDAIFSFGRKIYLLLLVILCCYLLIAFGGLREIIGVYKVLYILGLLNLAIMYKLKKWSVNEYSN